MKELRNKFDTIPEMRKRVGKAQSLEKQLQIVRDSWQKEKVDLQKKLEVPLLKKR